MKPIKSYEAISAKEYANVCGAFSPVAKSVAKMHEAHLAYGAGVIDHLTKCVWTQDGRRIEVWLGQGGDFGASCSKTPDPESPLLMKKAES